LRVAPIDTEPIADLVHLRLVTAADGGDLGIRVRVVDWQELRPKPQTHHRNFYRSLAHSALALSSVDRDEPMEGASLPTGRIEFDRRRREGGPCCTRQKEGPRQ